MGGGKGGADFDPKGKSDNEIRKFCYVRSDSSPRCAEMALTCVPVPPIGLHEGALASHWN